MSAATDAPKKLVDRFLNRVERIGNALPDPTTLFAIMTLLVILMSAVVAWFDVSVAHPKTGAEVRAVSLLTIEGLHRMMTGLVTSLNETRATYYERYRLAEIFAPVTRAPDRLAAAYRR